MKQSVAVFDDYFLSVMRIVTNLTDLWLNRLYITPGYSNQRSKDYGNFIVCRQGCFR